MVLKNSISKQKGKVIPLNNEAIHIHQTLISKCQEGDVRAMGEVYQLYSKAMFAVSQRIVNDFHEAEDILQESFVSAFKNLHSFRNESSFGAWLKRIVINKSLNHVKKKRLELSQLDERVHEQAEENNEIDEIEYTVEDIKSAMKELPDGYRVIFTLYMFEDLSHAEIAQRLGISESTSKSQLHRCKHKLKEIILNSRNYGKRQA